MNPRSSTRLAGFVTGVAVKQHLAPTWAVRPLVAELFLTENCNLRCISCGCWRETTRGELSTEEWQDVLLQLAELRIHKANFTGGEPLIRRDAVELMRFARDCGITNLHLNTNAIRLTDQRREAILDAGVASFNISVDAPSAAEHDRIRGRTGAFETTVRHLRALIAQRRDRDLKIRMNFTVMRENVELLPEIARLAQQLEVRLYLNLATDQTFLFRADGVDDLADVDDAALARALAEVEDLARADRRFLPRYSDLAYVRRHFRDPVQRGLPCAESQLKLMIHSRGEIGGCWGHDPEFSVRGTPIRDVISSDRYRAEHDRLFHKQCVGCGANYSLNLRVQPRTYVEDALWRAGRRSLAS